eukprot:SAG11_NODE_6495_length_1302_cov_1.963425_5_plen_98_part_00
MTTAGTLQLHKLLIELLPEALVLAIAPVEWLDGQVWWSSALLAHVLLNPCFFAMDLLSSAPKAFSCVTHLYYWLDEIVLNFRTGEFFSGTYCRFYDF